MGVQSVLKGEPTRLANGSQVGNEGERNAKGCSRPLGRDGPINPDNVVSDPAHLVPTQALVI